MKLSEENNKFFNALQEYLNFNSTAIGFKEMRRFDNKADTVKIYKRLVVAFMLMNGDYTKYLEYLTQEDVNDYINNPYYKNIHFNAKNFGKWRICTLDYKPFELFVKNDYIESNGLVMPQLGFFDRLFKYPCVEENGRVWMSITPNEINTMKKPIEKAKGNVLTFGLGLGYFSYMASLKEDVESVTIIENDSNVISLFEKFILPQFKFKDKIKIIKTDAYEFLDNIKEEYDYTFIDIYHDCSDGVDCYKKMIKYFENKTNYDFWIYDSIKYYL